MVLLGITTEKGRKVEFMVAAVTGHIEMKWAVGKEISKTVFLKEEHLSQELLECIALLFVKMPKEENSPSSLRVTCDCFIVLGISGFTISHMKELPARKDEPGDSKEPAVILLYLIS